MDLFRRFREVLAGHDDVELVAVNNGSRDHSALVLACELEKPENSFLRVVNVEVNQGYGYGILCGLRAAQWRVPGLDPRRHADRPARRAAGLRAVAGRARSAAVPAARAARRPTLVDRAFTTGMGWVASAALAAPLEDINAQPKIFHRDLLAEMDDAPWDFSLDLYLLYLAQRKGLEVLSSPCEFGQFGCTARRRAAVRCAARQSSRAARCQYIFRLRRQLRAA